MNHDPEPHVSQADHDSLRKLADVGNEKALDRLADLAHARDDVGELNELLDEAANLPANTSPHERSPPVTSPSSSGWPRKA